MSRLADIKASLTQRWKDLVERWRWLGHVLRAWAQLKRNNGTQYSAAITYFSFLALFPLILLAVAITGFVLHSDQHLQTELFDKITAQAPGELGRQLNSSIQSAIKARTTVGVIGLVTVLLTGLGWIGNIRQAIDAVWGRTVPKQNFLKAKASNLGVLAGLGVGVLVSLGLTIVGTSLTDQILRALDLDHVSGSHYLVKVLGILLALIGDMIIFGWLLVRLPAAAVSRSVAVRGALLAAAGFEVLKVLGTYTIAKSTHSPTLGPFASLLAVLIWIELVSRYLLFCAAWIATAGPTEAAAGSEPPVATLDRPRPTGAGFSPLGVAASLIGAGAAAGAAATAWLLRGKRAGPGRD